MHVVNLVVELEGAEAQKPSGVIEFHGTKTNQMLGTLGSIFKPRGKVETLIIIINYTDGTELNVGGKPKYFPCGRIIRLRKQGSVLVGGRALLGVKIGILLQDYLKIQHRTDGEQYARGRWGKNRTKGRSAGIMRNLSPASNLILITRPPKNSQHPTEW